MYVGFGCSMSIVLYHGFIKNVPLDLEEAATLDGCSMVRLFFGIVFPLLKTITVTVAILNVMWIWNDFLLPNLIIRLADTATKDVPVLWTVYQEMGSGNCWADPVHDPHHYILHQLPAVYREGCY